jgi:hypothetical protein
MLRLFFENKTAAAAVILLFGLAAILNVSNGFSKPLAAPGHGLLTPGPANAPDAPDELLMAEDHGASLPPDPWEEIDNSEEPPVVIDPTLPADQTEPTQTARSLTATGELVLLADDGHGASLPPDPWEEIDSSEDPTVVIDPTLPADQTEPTQTARSLTATGELVLLADDGHGASLPPDPWEEIDSTDGPTLVDPGLPPDPADQTQVA